MHLKKEKVSNPKSFQIMDLLTICLIITKSNIFNIYVSESV
jgi:hypothetical protein